MAVTGLRRVGFVISSLLLVSICGLHVVSAAEKAADRGASDSVNAQLGSSTVRNHRVAFFNTHHKGHYRPTLNLVQKLVTAGFEVAYFAPHSTAREVTALGAVHHDLLDDKNFSLKQASLDAVEQMGVEPDALLLNELLFVQVLPVTTVLFPWALEKLRVWDPVLVVYDSSCAWAKLAASRLRIAAVSSASATVMGAEQRVAVFDFLHERDDVTRALAKLK